MLSKMDINDQNSQNKKSHFDYICCQNQPLMAETTPILTSLTSACCVDNINYDKDEVQP